MLWFMWLLYLSAWYRYMHACIASNAPLSLLPYGCRLEAPSGVPAMTHQPAGVVAAAEGPGGGLGPVAGVTGGRAPALPAPTSTTTTSSGLFMQNSGGDFLPVGHTDVGHSGFASPMSARRPAASQATRAAYPPKTASFGAAKRRRGVERGEFEDVQQLVGAADKAWKGEGGHQSDEGDAWGDEGDEGWQQLDEGGAWGDDGDEGWQQLDEGDEGGGGQQSDDAGEEDGEQPLNDRMWQKGEAADLYQHMMLIRKDPNDKVSASLHLCIALASLGWFRGRGVKAIRTKMDQLVRRGAPRVNGYTGLTEAAAREVRAKWQQVAATANAVAEESRRAKRRTRRLYRPAGGGSGRSRGRGRSGGGAFGAGGGSYGGQPALHAASGGGDFGAGGGGYGGQPALHAAWWWRLWGRRLWGRRPWGPWCYI